MLKRRPAQMTIFLTRIAKRWKIGSQESVVGARNVRRFFELLEQQGHTALR